MFGTGGTSPRTKVQRVIWWTVFASFATFVAYILINGRTRDALNDGHSTSRYQDKVLMLDYSSDKHRRDASVGERIDVALQLIGPGEYGTPEISSPAVRYEYRRLMPLSPGGPSYQYIFTSESEGEAIIKIPVVNTDDPAVAMQRSFTATIRVGGPIANQPH
jgi:hypothetical protein